jgi:hypothetical protein
VLPDDANIEFETDDVLARGANLITAMFAGELVLMFASDLKTLAVLE